jgi:acetolactate synthase I/II/III large subunit
MTRKSRRPGNIDRRKFFSAVAVAGATAAIPAAPEVAAAADAAAPSSRNAAPTPASPPSAAQLAADVGAPQPPESATGAIAVGASCGSDFMVDVIKSLGIDYIFSNPGSSFLGLHESIVNYGGNKAPEFITCMHEESAVAMANGYYKAALKPAASLCHSTVGLQHAAMALYNAWCDRVPVVTILGNTLDLTKRMGGNDWRHSAQDPVAMVRDFTKWDDQPTTLQGFAESFVQAIL